MKNLKRASFLTLAVAWVVAAASVPLRAADKASGTFDRTLSVDGAVDLTLLSPYGDVTIRTGDSATVKVHARVKASSKRRHKYTADEKVRMITENPPVVQTGNRISIGEIEDEDLYEDVQIHYDLVVPAETGLDAKTGYGNVDVTGVRRPVEIATGYGDVRLSEPTGRVSVRTGYGNIEITGHPTEDWTLRSGYGDIRLELPPDAAFAVDFRTGYGGVDSDHPLTLEGRLSGSRVRGQVRGGGPEIRARTGYGDLSLR